MKLPPMCLSSSVSVAPIPLQYHTATFPTLLSMHLMMGWMMVPRSPVTRLAQVPGRLSVSGHLVFSAASHSDVPSNAKNQVLLGAVSEAVEDMFVNDFKKLDD